MFKLTAVVLTWYHYLTEATIHLLSRKVVRIYECLIIHLTSTVKTKLTEATSRLLYICKFANIKWTYGLSFRVWRNTVQRLKLIEMLVLIVY